VRKLPSHDQSCACALRLTGVTRHRNLSGILTLLNPEASIPTDHLTVFSTISTPLLERIQTACKVHLLMAAVASDIIGKIIDKLDSLPVSYAKDGASTGEKVFA